MGFLIPAILVAGLADVTKVELQSKTIDAFDNYVRIAGARIGAAREGGPFLWTDGTPVRREHVRKGDIVVEPWAARGDLEMPGGFIHDWIGAVFVPGATIEKTIRLVEDYNNHKVIYKPEVIDSQLVARNGDEFQVRLRLLKKQVITVVLDTEHRVRYTQLDQARWSSHSYSTRIAELADPGTPAERELPPGRDHGFLWRLNTDWRFEEKDGGVYIECEAISLSRNVPVGLGWLVNPIIRTLPRDSLANTLRATRDAVK